MRAFLAVIILALVVVAVTGYSLGWFAVSTTNNDQKTTLSVTINKAEWHADKEDYRQQAETKLHELDKKIGDLRTRLPQLPTEARDSMKRAIAQLRQQEQAVRTELADAASSTKEHWESIKPRLAEALGDLEHGVQKAWSRFQEQ